MQYPVVVVEYDSKWPIMYEKEKQVIARLLGEHILSIEHVGSTAVPGLAAKPIIDIMIGVKNLDEGRQTCIQPLQDIGYHYVPDFEIELPDRCFLYRGSEDGHSHHVHITEPNSIFWIEHILFRDYLRKYPAAAEKYGELKQHLAQKYKTQRAEYGQAKTDFIQNVLGKARKEFGVDE
jgi:GrpB-like predicted nucleotidyltransferase (UPF0157 family)